MFHHGCFFSSALSISILFCLHLEVCKFVFTFVSIFTISLPFVCFFVIYLLRTPLIKFCSLLRIKTFLFLHLGPAHNGPMTTVR